MKYTYLLILILITSLGLQAQQAPTYAFYKNHFNLINPAVTGTQGGSYANLSLREQWVNVEGAPSTQALSMGFPHKNNRVGLGFSLVNDQLNVEQQTFFAADFSYRLPLEKEQNLYLGLKAGANAYRLNASDAKVYNASGAISDPFLEDYSRLLPNIGVGVYYTSQRGYLAFSIPRLLNTQRQKEEDGQQTTATDRPHLFFSGGIQTPLNETIAFSPSFLLSYVNAAPIQLTLDAAFLFNEKFEAGIQYNTTTGIGGTALVIINPGFKLGYAYSSPVSNAIERISNGTHELVLKIRLNKALLEETSPEETTSPNNNNSNTNHQ